MKSYLFNTCIKYIKNRIFKLFLKHLVISVICASADFSIFFIAYFLLSNITIAYATGFIFSSIIGFIGHSYFTFDINKIYFINAILFLLQISSAYIIGFNLLNVLIQNEINIFLAKLIQMACVFNFNVVFGRLVTFKRR